MGKTRMMMGGGSAVFALLLMLAGWGVVRAFLSPMTDELWAKTAETYHWTLAEADAPPKFAGARASIVKAGTAEEGAMEMVTRLEPEAQAGRLGANGYHDLGLAYARLGENGAAMAAWAAGLALAPRDPALRHLWDELCAHLAGQGRAAQDWRHGQFLVPLSTREWWWAAVACMSLSLALGAWGLLRRMSHAGKWLLAASALATSIAWAGYFWRREKSYPLAAVVSHEAPLYAEPRADSALRLFNLPEASPLRIRERREGWARVETWDGRQAWLARRDFAVYGDQEGD